eukprot:361720-Chlamydomonas_euryale.AAC.7
MTCPPAPLAPGLTSFFLSTQSYSRRRVATVDSTTTCWSQRSITCPFGRTAPMTSWMGGEGKGVGGALMGRMFGSGGCRCLDKGGVGGALMGFWNGKIKGKIASWMW